MTFEKGHFLPEPKKQHQSASQAVLGVLALSAVFFPTIFASVSAPYVLDWFMYIYWGTGFMSFVFLTYSYYAAAFIAHAIPVRSIGLGNLFAAISLGSLFIFTMGNIVSDRTSAPRVVSLILESNVMKHAEFLRASAVGADDDKDNLKWDWCIRPSKETRAMGAKTIQLDGDIRNAVWEVPNHIPAGSYYVEVTVTDGAKQSKRVRQSFRVER